MHMIAVEGWDCGTCVEHFEVEAAQKFECEEWCDSLEFFDPQGRIQWPEVDLDEEHAPKHAAPASCDSWRLNHELIVVAINSASRHDGIRTMRSIRGWQVKSPLQDERVIEATRVPPLRL